MKAKVVAKKTVAKKDVASKKAAPIVKKVAAKKLVAKVPEPPAPKPVPVVTKKSKKKAAEVVVPQKPAPYIHHDLTSGCYFFVYEDIRCPVDDDCLAHTLGCANYGYGRGMVDKWSDAVWQRLLRYLDLPADPIVREVAAPPIKRLVQATWMRKFSPKALEEGKETFDLRDLASVKKYKEELAEAVTAVAEKSERAKTNLVASRGERVERVYTPGAALKDTKLVLTGQPQLILAYFRKSKFAPATCKQIADALVAAGLKTSQPPERVATHYLNIWKAKGWVSY